MSKTFSIKIAGPAGSGVKSFGETLAKTLFYSGYHVFGYTEYPSLVRGGHNTYQITIRSDQKNLNADHLDILLPLTQTAYNQETNNIKENTLVIADNNLELDQKYQIFQADFVKISTDLGNHLVLNTIYFAFLSKILKIDFDLAKNQLSYSFNHKSTDIININLKAFESALNIDSQKIKLTELPHKNIDKNLINLTGNEAVALGAIAAGLDFYSAYPMTPSSSVLHYLVKEEKSQKYTVYQSEDEISAINMALGASFAGARSMTGTSGGGFALMTETISLAGITELPLVIFLAQRPGPATGMSTWTAQGDLLFAVNAGHGEFPKIILSPSDSKSALLLTHKAFELSQKYQLPVIIMSDKYLAESLFTVFNPPLLSPVHINTESKFNHKTLFYPRYQDTSDGIHLRTIPGQKNGEYNANSSEHDIYGFASNKISDRNLQTNRRLKKIENIKKDLPLPKTPDNLTSTALISWGSTRDIAATIVESVPKLTHLHFEFLYPLPEKTADLLAKFDRLVVLENNLTHQFARLLIENISRKIDLCLGADTGRPLDPNDYIKTLKNYVK